MTTQQYNFCVAETASYTDRAAYISDLALSSMWESSETGAIDLNLVDDLGAIWDACQRSPKEIAADAGLSQRKLAERFYVPYRTVEDWCSGARGCNLYLRLMMQECLGLLNVIDG